MAVKVVRDILVASAGVTALVGQRISPVLKAQDTTLPAVTLQRVSLVPLNALNGAPTLDANRVQVDSWAATYAEARSVADACRTALEAANVAMVSEIDGEYEPDVLAYRVTQDFSVWT